MQSRALMRGSTSKTSGASASVVREDNFFPHLHHAKPPSEFARLAAAKPSGRQVRSSWRDYALGTRVVVVFLTNDCCLSQEKLAGAISRSSGSNGTTTHPL